LKIGGTPSGEKPRIGEAPARGDRTASTPAAGRVSPPKNLSRTLDSLLSLWKLPAPIGSGKILERLTALPPRERGDALTLLLLLEKRNLPLKEGEWVRLWDLVREGKAFEGGPPKGEDLLEKAQAETDYPLPAPGEELNWFRIFRDGGGRGSAALSLEEGRIATMVLRLERGGRKWEFLLTRTATGKGEDLMTVFTDDRGLAESPPPPWEEFRRALGGYGIFVERFPKYFQEDSFFSDTDSREPGRLVDILL